MPAHALVTFDQGQVPTIDIISKNKTKLGLDLHKLLQVTRHTLGYHFGPIWGVHANVQLSSGFTPGHWALVLIDDMEQAEYEGYHSLTPDGLPIGYAFVKTSLANKDDPVVTYFHELFEMLVDPGIQLAALNDDGTVYAYEVCDAVEYDVFKVDGVDVSNFQYPSWFESFRAPGSTQFDHCNLCKSPYEIRNGGYMSVYENGEWKSIFANKEAKARAEKQEDAPNHIRSLRRAGYLERNVRSKPGAYDVPPVPDGPPLSTASVGPV